jgi:HAMP domain-containing protein
MPLLRRLRTWRGKLSVLLLAFALVPLVAQAMWDYLAMRRAFQRFTLDSLRGLAHAKAQAIEQLTEDRRTQVERIAGVLAPRIAALPPAARTGGAARGASGEPLPDLQDAEALPTSGPPARPPAGAGSAPVAPPSATLPQLREALALLLWDQGQFEELMVIDPQGRVLASTHEEHEGHDASGLDYFRAGRGATFVQPVFLSPITEQLTMINATPIRHPERGVQGVLAARLNLARLFSVLTETTGLGRTGETVVVRRADDRLLFMAPTRHDPEAALVRSLPLTGEPAPGLLEALQGRPGAGEIRDYRGEKVLAAWERVPTLDWALMSTIERGEALRPAVRAGLRTLALMLPLVLGVVVVSLLVSRALVEPLSTLRSAADRISRGDFEVELQIDSRDEIGQLADSFERMVAAIKFFRAHSRGEDDEEVEASGDDDLASGAGAPEAGGGRA